MSNATKTLNDGTVIPTLALGVYQASGPECYQACLWALQAGYRHIDTAALYHNEEAVGRAVRESGIPRMEIFITSKMMPESFKYETALKKGQESRDTLGTEIDLYLLHAPGEHRLEAWKACIELQRQGVFKSIGVSNYGVHHLEEILKAGLKLPSVNQIELHPWCQQSSVREFCDKHNIALEAYSPLARAKKMDDATLVSIAQKHNKTPSQVLVKWSLQMGWIALPKSVREDRIRENRLMDAWCLDTDDMDALRALDENMHIEWDPTTWP